MIMSVFFCRYLNICSAVAAACILAACTTTNTGSEGGIEAASEISAPAEPEVAEVVEPLEEQAEIVQTETQIQTEPTPIPLEAEDEPDSVSSESAQTEVVEEMVVFPEQRYEIEEPLEIETESDAEIDRLRDELAASESELALARAREAERDFASDQAGSTAADSGEMGAAIDEDGGPPEHTTTAQASNVPEPGINEGGSNLADKPTEYSIHFGYNQTTLEREFESIVVMHAEFLKANPDLNVEIQGNCDERGSREYNIALGGRRAYTVKRALELLGVDGQRIRTVSFGAEKPIAYGQDEESWRQNRRADIVY